MEGEICNKNANSWAPPQFNSGPFRSLAICILNRAPGVLMFPVHGVIGKPFSRSLRGTSINVICLGLEY